MLTTINILYFVVVCCFRVILCAQNTDFGGFLSGDFATYNKKIFPRNDQSSQIVVSMKYSLIGVNKMDENLGQIEFAGFFEATWTNDFLTSWSAAIDEMVIPQDNVWKPPLMMHNTMETAKLLSDRSNKIRINKDGTHTWKVGVVSKTSCVITLSHYPFDKHKCSLEFTPWGYMEEQLKLENSTADVDLTYYRENVQWNIDSTSVETSTIKGASYLIIHIKIARRPGNVLVNYALPVLILSLLSSLAYMMPAESGERIAYAVVAFLTLVIHITMIADNIPRSSTPITILSLYLTLMLVMGSLSIAIATLTLRIYSQEDIMEIPLWLKHVTTFLKCQKGKRCCPKKKKKGKLNKRSDSIDGLYEDDDSSYDDDEGIDEENLDWDEMQWKDVGHVFDWSFFLLFFFTSIVIALFYYFSLAYA